MKTNSLDVAKYILDKLGTLTTMKLQKLVYYCQAWSLVWDDSPLFDDPIEAWANGPVCVRLYNAHRGMFDISTMHLEGHPELLDNNQIDTINKVLDAYGDKSSKWLIDLTHLEQPWIDARNGLGPSERGNAEITFASMAEYYSSL